MLLERVGGLDYVILTIVRMERELARSVRLVTGNPSVKDTQDRCSEWVWRMGVACSEWVWQVDVVC